jgi:hypothetical protein
MIGRPTINRRGLILGCGATLLARRTLAQPLPVPAGRSLAFDVIRKGSVIGVHRLTFDGDDRNVTVKVAVDLHVGLGPIVLFRYRHRAAEVWKEGRLDALDTETDNDGRECKVTGRRIDAGFVVEGSGAPRYVAPENALPATHWNRRMLDGPLINTQDGRLMQPEVKPLGIEPIPSASGAPIEARHFALSGVVTLDTWYDLNAAWAGVRFQAADRSEVRYERL